VTELLKLTFYGGVNEIGGNKILLEDKKTRIFFDFGQSFTFGSEYFTGWLTPRSINGLGDYFAFNLLPKISGIYSKEMLASTKLLYTEPQINAVFLSHAHFDHITHIQFLDPKIPIHMGLAQNYSWNQWRKQATSASMESTTATSLEQETKSKSAKLVLSRFM
jgi:ribonuclease J